MFSKEWDDCYSRDEQLSTWPWSDLVSLVSRYYGSDIKTKKKIKILELGCGAGANIPFFMNPVFDYYGIDGSRTIVEVLQIKYPQLISKIVAKDFTEGIKIFGGGFDLVVDRAAITHNDLTSILKTLESIKEVLNPHGHFIGIDWFSTKHSDYTKGFSGGDEYTRTQIESGQFFGVGKVHFSDENHLLDLFSKFTVVYMAEKEITQTIPHLAHKFSSWNIVAKNT